MSCGVQNENNPITQYQWRGIDGVERDGEGFRGIERCVDGWIWEGRRMEGGREGGERRRVMESGEDGWRGMERRIGRGTKGWREIGRDGDG